MPPLVFCTCRSHCSQYDAERGTYTGGQLVSRATRYQHRKDDIRSKDLGNFATEVASAILDEGSHLGLSRGLGDLSTLSSLATEILSQELLTIEREVHGRITWAPTDWALVFAIDPVPDQDFEDPLSVPSYIPNSGLHALRLSHQRNLAFIENENRLFEVVLHLNSLTNHPEQREALTDVAITGLQTMMYHKRREWDRQRNETTAIENGFAVVHTGLTTQSLVKLSFVDVRTEEYLEDRIPREPTIVVAMLTVLLMHLVFHLSRRATMVMLAGMRCMLSSLGANRELIDQLPNDPRSVLNRFNLDPRCSSFLQCPVCYALYPYSGTITSVTGGINRCPYKSTPSSPPCNTPLWEERRSGGSTFLAPRRKYIHQSLKEWVGRLLARPGIPELFREPCNRPPTTVMGDIWDAPVLRNFKDVDGRSFFRDRGNEIRLAFSLNADGFNPFHMIEAKQSVSCTAIYMAVLNFPEHLRFLFRNMYLAGVIPGPGKPSLDQINHALSLVVAELLEFWRGVYYTVIFASPSGCLTKGAMIPLICDMLSARQLTGLSSATSTLFCTFCLLTIQDIENLDKSTWPARDLVAQIEHAKLWRDSSSEADRDACFKAHGVHWSVLLDLPYWNPILFSVIDSMHAAHLGLFHSHCRKVWRIDVSADGGEGMAIQPAKDVPRPSDRTLSRWLAIIRDSPDTTALRRSLMGSDGCPKDVLWHICVDNKIRSAGGRRQLVDNIIGWRNRAETTPIELPACAASSSQTPDNSDFESIASESSLDASSLQFREKEKIDKTNKLFIEHKIGKSTLKRLKVAILQTMCRSRSLDDGGTREALAMRLINWRESNIPRPREPEPGTETREVLGRDVLEAVWDDMTRTELPSWMSPAPRNWGTAARGKLTADQWKVIATVHLPITLIRLWGTKEGRHLLLLCNFMDLSAAVQLASQRIITQKHIDDYERLILRYLQGMKVMFKDTPLQPIHHVSLHAGEFLKLFGPTHPVRTPGFERFNERLGSQNTNMKSGDLEATFTMTACRAANLEWMMHSENASDHIRPLLDAFLRVSNEDHRGTRLADENHFPPQKPPQNATLEPHIYKLFLTLISGVPSLTRSNLLAPITPNVLELEKVSISGVIYAREKSLPRDSNIIFRRPGGSSDRVGRIKQIFRSEHVVSEVTLLVVAQYRLVSDPTVQGTYRRFGFAGGYLCDPGEDGRRYVIRSTDVICHFARTVLVWGGETLMHALPLNSKMIDYQVPMDYTIPEF
ncbi:hypothetical protein BDM02DRAFT_3187692 [Thelephora ganbajun]|uniref:Uncharacterized protein n=1 Tax=Thelephora ganbajun TaxID=370292 RepID=A0ACB6ZED6_THEGA|nr:hypothetical protein BDM02DRAFT_3187692 [Thelephora ganbajun]